MNKTALLIQGPDTYLDQMYDHYKPIEDRVIWSAWNGSKWKFEHTQFSQPPPQPGYGNSNLQFEGGLAGCQMAEDLGFTHVLKIRPDFLIHNYEKVLDEFFDPYRLNFLAFHEWDGGYLVDYIIGGPIKLLMSIWDYDTCKHGAIFAERVLYNRLMDHSIQSVNYLAPKMIEHSIKCYALKWQFDVTNSIKTDPLFTYRDPLPKI